MQNIVTAVYKSATIILDVNLRKLESLRIWGHAPKSLSECDSPLFYDNV